MSTCRLRQNDLDAVTRRRRKLGADAVTRRFRRAEMLPKTMLMRRMTASAPTSGAGEGESSMD
eukprot:8772067-Lingulodinium_polyedra.AAC.1